MARALSRRELALAIAKQNGTVLGNPNWRPIPTLIATLIHQLRAEGRSYRAIAADRNERGIPDDAGRESLGCADSAERLQTGSRMTYDHPYWAGYLAAAIATAVRNIEGGHEPADVTTCLRRDLMSYLNSSAGQPIRQLLQERMNGNNNETTSNEKHAAETNVR